MTEPKPDDVHPAIGHLVEARGDDRPRSPTQVRDDEARIALLPLCTLAPFDRREAARVTLAMYPVAFWLAGGATATVMEWPDESWQGWQWSRHECVVLHVERDPALLREVVTHAAPGFSRLDIVGRPMCVWRVAPGDSGWAANAYAGHLDGYLDDTTGFWGQVVAPTEERRETLLAGLATLERLPGRPS
jgi:hypothetical protein